MKKYLGVLVLALSVCILSCDDEDNVVEPVVVYGCIDVNAMNYDANATDDNGSCEYSTAYMFSGSWKITHLEYEMEMDPTSIDASTLPADYATYLEHLGDNIIPVEGEAENAGTYYANDSDNTYTVNLAFSTEPITVLGFELPGMPINFNSEGTWVLQNNNEGVVFVDGATRAQQFYEIENLTENLALLRGTLIMPLEVEFIGRYDFKVKLVMQLRK